MIFSTVPLVEGVIFYIDATAYQNLPAYPFYCYISFCFVKIITTFFKNRKENPQKLTQLSSRSHPRHLVGKRTAQKDTIIDITSNSQVNSFFPYRWSPADLFRDGTYLFIPHF